MVTFTSTVPASLAAKWLISHIQADPEQDVDNLKLQKLLYLAQSKHLHEYGVPLVSEPFQAWRHGPVLKTVYSECSTFGSSPIVMDLADDGPWLHLPERATKVIQSIWEAFGGYSSWKLRDITHDVGPWDQYFAEGARNVTIPNDKIGAAWPDFARLMVEPIKPNPVSKALAKYRATLAGMPKRERTGDASALLSDTDSMQSLMHEADSVYR